MITSQPDKQIDQIDTIQCRTVTAGKYVRNLFRQCRTYGSQLMGDLDSNIDIAQELLIQTGFLKEPFQEPSKSNVLLLNMDPAPQSL